MSRTEKPRKRLWVDAELDGASLVLSTEQAHYLGRVLRCREGDSVVVFNARGREREGTVSSLGRRRPLLDLGADVEPLPEPETPVMLLQALVKSDAMDLIVQKATELGVTTILGVHTEFSVVRLDAERRERKLSHWQRIATSACEQSGRHRPPALELHDSLPDAIAAVPDGMARIALDLGPGPGLAQMTYDDRGVCLAIGPEGGFSPAEQTALSAAGFERRSLGPRTLRAETAAIAAIAAARLLGGG